MSDQHAVSRRATLKTLGTMGAAIALGVPASADEGTRAVPVADLAVGRMAKGHS